MAKKRKTLPKNFKELIEDGNIDSLKAVFDKCELTAHDGNYSKNTALHFRGVPDEFVRWFVENGADINAQNYYGETPLCHQSRVRKGAGTVKLLLELGADIKISSNSGTPLHAAVSGFSLDIVRSLVEAGADIHEHNSGYFKMAPLESCLAHCRNMDIPGAADVAELLLKSGAEITPKSLGEVKRIGKEFEFHRSSFSTDFLAETQAGLNKLYRLFNVEPVAARREHDGVSAVSVSSATWQEQHQELWDYLVPSNGKAATVQGEVIRITGRISDEFLRNGGVNWDKDYQKMLASLQTHFVSGNPLSAVELAETATLSKALSGGDGDDECKKLAEFAVKWVLLNPCPIKMNGTDYKR